MVYNIKCEGQNNKIKMEVTKMYKLKIIKGLGFLYNEKTKSLQSLINFDVEEKIRRQHIKYVAKSFNEIK